MHPRCPSFISDAAKNEPSINNITVFPQSTFLHYELTITKGVVKYRGSTLDSSDLFSTVPFHNQLFSTVCFHYQLTIPKSSGKI